MYEYKDAAFVLLLKCGSLLYIIEDSWFREAHGRFTRRFYDLVKGANRPLVFEWCSRPAQALVSRYTIEIKKRRSTRKTTRKMVQVDIVIDFRFSSDTVVADDALCRLQVIRKESRKIRH